MFGFPLPIISWLIYYGIGLVIIAMIIAPSLRGAAPRCDPPAL